MPEPIRTIVVDDEAPARALLREYLGAWPDIEVVAECADGFEAVRRIEELAPDLVLLDIQMPKLDGFEVLELLRARPAVIFCTAYDEHAVRAFEIQAVDYLLKPYGPERLEAALQRARARLAHGGSAAPVVDVKRLRGEAFSRRLVIRDGVSVHVIPVEKIDYIKAEDDYVAVHCGGRSFLKQQTMTEIEGLLDPEHFVRVHRSYLVALDRIARIEPYGGDSRIAILRDKQEIPVSRKGYQRLTEAMGR